MIIPYGRQSISESDLRAVLEVLQSDWLTQGPVVPRFEKTVASYLGVDYGIASNSATSSLHLACLALGVGPGDYVWTSPNTFVATANCALYCGANIDFVDIDSRTYNMSIARLEEKLIEARKENKLPKVVIPVHFAGQPCDMYAIHALSRTYGFKIIEDASHAIGASYRTKTDILDKSSSEEYKVGSCTHSDITIFSFHPVKIITTAEGGLAVTNDKELATRMEMLRTHGITRNFELMSPRMPKEIWNYQQIGLGFNYRMTELQGALGISQFERLNIFVQKRRDIARRYDEAFTGLPVITPWQSPTSYSSYHLYVVSIKENPLGRSRNYTYKYLLDAGIGVNLHYMPVYRHPFYERLGFSSGYCPQAELYSRECITIPIFPTLSADEQAYIISALKGALKT